MATSDRIDWRLALRAGVVQLLAVGVVFAVLAISLPHSFFEDWGVVAGPSAWIVCALVTARVLRLPFLRTLAVAAGTGLVAGGAGQLIGHEPGIVLGVLLFAVGCGAALEPVSRARG
jgi:hypothetical protein